MNGWARRLDRGSIVWHYFRHTGGGGHSSWSSICGKHWTDPELPVAARVEGMACPRCVALRMPA